MSRNTLRFGIFTLVMLLWLPLAFASIDFSATSVERITACPCTLLTSAIQVQNTGTEVEVITVAIGGPAAAWTTYAPTELFLMPGAQEKVFLYIQAPCTAQGAYALIIDLTANDGLKKRIEQQIVYDRCMNADIVPIISEQSVCSGELAQYQFSLANTGTFIEGYEITPQDVVQYSSLYENPVFLAPGDSRIVDVFIQFPGDRLGNITTNILVKALTSGITVETPVTLTLRDCNPFTLQMGARDPQTLFNATQDATYTICQGAQYTIPYQITNLGSISAEFTPYLMNAPSWAAIDPAPLALGAGQSATGYIAVEAPFDSVSVQQPTIIAQRAGVSHSVPFTLDIQNCYTPEIAEKRPTRIPIPRAETFTSIPIQNTGTQEATYRFSILTNEAWITLNPEQGILQPGEEAFVELKTIPTAETASGAYPIILTVTTQDDLEYSKQFSLVLDGGFAWEYVAYASAGLLVLLVVILIMLMRKKSAQVTVKEAVKREVPRAYEKPKRPSIIGRWMSKGIEFIKAHKAAVLINGALVIVAALLFFFLPDVLELLGLGWGWIADYRWYIASSVALLIIFIILAVHLINRRVKKTMVSERRAAPEKIAAPKKPRRFLWNAIKAIIVVAFITVLVYFYEYIPDVVKTFFLAYWIFLISGIAVLIVFIVIARWLKRRPQTEEKKVVIERKVAPKIIPEDAPAAIRVPKKSLIIPVLLALVIILGIGYVVWQSVDWDLVTSPEHLSVYGWYYIAGAVIALIMIIIFVRFGMENRRTQVCSLAPYPADTSISFPLKPATGLGELTLTLKKRSTGKVTVRGLGRKPTFLRAASLVYQYVELDPSDLDENAFTNLSVRFKVRKTWLIDHNLSSEDIVFRRYEDNAWTDVPTKIVDQDNTFVYFEAKLVYFSYFAICAQEEAAEREAPEVEEPTQRSWIPYLVLFAIIAVLLGLSYYISMTAIPPSLEEEYSSDPILDAIPGNYQYNSEGDVVNRDTGAVLSREEYARLLTDSIESITAQTSIRREEIAQLITILNPDQEVPESKEGLPTQIMTEDIQQTLDLTTYFTDPDGDVLMFTAIAPEHITILIQGGIATFVPEKDWYGIATATFIADDGKGGINESTVTLIVRDAPEPSGLAAVKERVTRADGQLQSVGSWIKNNFRDYWLYAIIGIIVLVILIAFIVYHKKILDFLEEDTKKKK